MNNINIFFKKFFLKKTPSNDNSEVLYNPLRMWSSGLLWAIMGSVGFGLVYSFVARIDEVVVVRGELQGKGAERPIKAPFNSLVRDIKVQEGQKVEMGSVLIELDATNYEAQYEVLKAKLDSLLITKDFQKNIVDRLLTLKEEGGISLIDFLKEKNKLQENKSEILQIKARLNELNSDIIKTKLRSPIKGTVFNLIPANPGYFASVGETLLLIVPEGALEAKIFLTNNDIGFVKEDMSAEVRVDSYPFTQFGSIKGLLKSIGKESLPADQLNSQSRFPAIVELDKQFLLLNDKKYKLKSGQSVSVNLIIRDKPIITLLTDSVENAFDALRGIKSDRK